MFSLNMQREDDPWEHRERAVYTVNALIEEMKARLRPASTDDSGDEKSKKDR
jgi:ABC-type transporter lipoprotein component MlaA